MPATTTTNGTRGAPTPTGPPRPATTLDSGARRNRSRAAAGALLLTVCTFGAVLIFGRVGDRQAVVALARTVEVGQIIEMGDLRTVHVSADPDVHPVPASQRSQIVGRPAGVRLLAGTMLSKSQVGDATGLPKGMALVGAILKPGQYPLGLAPGDTVALVVSSPGSTTAADQSQSGPPIATVVAVAPAADATGNTAATLQVPLPNAPVVAEAGAAGQLSLLVIGR